MNLFPTPHLLGNALLDEEREKHILIRHPELSRDHLELIGDVLLRPDNVRSSSRDHTALLFSRYFPDFMGGKHIVVVVVSNSLTAAHRIITAYVTRRIIEGHKNV